MNNALLWYRNCKSKFRTWKDFLEDFALFFYPPEYKEGLEEEIRRRMQKKGESGQQFIISLQTLIRRHGGFSKERELMCIYKHLLPEYRQYIRRQHISCVNDLIQEIQEFETLQKEVQTVNMRERNAKVYDLHAMSLTPERKTDSKTACLPARQHTEDLRRNEIVCWRCGQNGHLRWKCKNPPRLFCSRCGKQGIPTRDCPCNPLKSRIYDRKQENGNGTAEKRNAPVSPHRMGQNY